MPAKVRFWTARNPGSERRLSIAMQKTLDTSTGLSTGHLT